MNRLNFFIALFFLSVAASGQTVFKINQYNILYGSTFMPVFTLYSGHSFNDQWGFSAYFYVNGTKGSSWGEGLAGPSWKPAKGLTLSLLAGFQTNEDQLFRFSPLIIYNNRQFSSFASFEVGGKRHRWDVMAFWLKDSWKVGAELIRFYQLYAAGPRVEFSFLKNQPLTVFLSGLWDWKNSKPAWMFGLYTSFSSLKK